MKRIISKFSLVIFLVFISLQTYSQKQYKPGFIITNDMEKIEGEIEILSDIFNAQYLNFNDGNTLIRYTPDQINSWGVEDKRIFVSKTIIKNEEEKAVFLEYIIKGYTSFLTYTAENQEIRYFIQKGEDQIRELKMGRRVNEEGKEVVYQEYLGVLRILFDDCEEIKEQISSTTFSLSGFTKIVKNYNNCINSEEAFFERKIKKENFIGFEFLIGYNFPSFDISKKSNDDPLHLITQTNVESKSFISLGLNFSFNIPRLNGVSANLGALYGKWEFDAIHNDNEPLLYELEQTIYSYEYTIMTIPLSLRYTYKINKFKPFIEIGYSYSIMPTNYSYIIIKRYDTDGLVDKTKNESNILFKSRLSGLHAGIGMKYEAFKFGDVFVKVEYLQRKWDGLKPHDVVVTDYSWLTSEARIISVLIGFSF